MDFSQAHKKTPSVTTKSNIKILPLPENEKDDKDSINNMLIKCANQAAIDLFQCHQDENGDKEEEVKMANSSHYPEHSIIRTDLITPNSLCVIFESFDNLNFVYATPKAIFSNRNGHFHHDDFLNKPYGCKIRSRNNQGLGYVYILRPTIELWTRSLNHRTQIIHELDASVILFHLHIRPGMVVCESGTGSGSMSHAFMRTLAPSGHLHTYEFNKARADAARVEFAKNKVDHLVTVHHRDVCGKNVTKTNEKEDDSNHNSVENHNKGGFGPISTPNNKTPQSKHIVDAILLDLPEPWLAIVHAKEILKPNGRIGSYSPCVEQSQRTIEQMKAFGFHSIKTIEVRLKEYYVDQVEMELPPTSRLPEREGSMTWKHTDLADHDNHKDNIENMKEEKDANMKTQKDTNDHSTTDGSISILSKCMSDNNPSNMFSFCKKRKRLCARPFGTMRGHTAFLTFATAGLS